MIGQRNDSRANGTPLVKIKWNIFIRPRIAVSECESLSYYVERPKCKARELIIRKKPYKFQVHALCPAIKCLRKRHGCIDSCIRVCPNDVPFTRSTALHRPHLQLERFGSLISSCVVRMIVHLASLHRRTSRHLAPVADRLSSPSSVHLHHLLRHHSNCEWCKYLLTYPNHSKTLLQQVSRRNLYKQRSRKQESTDRQRWVRSGASLHLERKSSSLPYSYCRLHKNSCTGQDPLVVNYVSLD